MNALIHALLREAALLLAVNLALWGWMAWGPVVVQKVRWLPLGGLGLALPGLILLRPEAWREEILRHELAHQAQMRRWSPLGAALILGWHYGRGFVTARTIDRATFMDLYQSNPLEREAFAAMHENGPLPRVRGWQA